MRVLITSNYFASNTYLKNIADSLKGYCELVCDPSSFWSSNLAFDIIHIQWPEDLFEWKTITELDLQRLESRLAYWKQKGAKIVATRHNSIPHRQERFDYQLYEMVYDVVDGVIHLGEYSKKYLASRTIDTVIFHPSYQDIYKETNQDQSRTELGLPRHGLMFLSVGVIRKKMEERYLVESFKRYRKNNRKDYLVLCNARYLGARPTFAINPFKRICWELRYILKKRLLKINGIILGEDNLLDERLVSYLGAADVLVCPRIDSLNSGIIFLGYTFQKAVVGADVGNMTEFLRATGNPVAVALDKISLRDALLNVAKLNRELGKRNKRFVEENCDPDMIAKKHIDFYNSVKEVSK